jgi:DeoR family glycerol-3-phosphate regulon repressor
MVQNLRAPAILELARVHGKVTVDDLVIRLDVTAQTIRRDLTELADAGLLDRVHGGAVLSSGITNIAYNERRALNDTAKEAIGRATAALIPDGSSIFLNIGTTTESVARHLRDRKALLVLTNNVNIATQLAPYPEMRVVLAGGQMRHADMGLVGPETGDMVRRYKPDFGIIGCSALDLSGDLLDFDGMEVAVTKAILEQSRQNIAVVDQSKLHRSAPVRVASLTALDDFVTDAMLPTELSAICQNAGTTIHIA